MIGLLLWLAACELDLFKLPPDREWQGDYDGDGWDAGLDCNDMDEDVGPHAFETCDGVDSNCSGGEDDAADVSAWYADLDGDGFGDPDTALWACAAPRGWINLGGDCDDEAADVFPGAREECGDGVDRNCDGAVDWDDGDGDGVPSCLDCNDADPFSFPDAAERCDGRDNDCDGTVDEDLPEGEAPDWHPDYDGDGFGNPDVTVSACSRPGGWVLDGTDCDDLDEARSPGADEACDNQDNDCDDDVDEADPGNTRWYPDGDGDGYGDGEWIATCTGPDGYASADGDCDDADPTLNPDTTWYRDADRDGYGAASTYVQCGQPYGYDRDSGDCDDGDATRSPAADETCDGEDDDCDGATDEDEAVDAVTWYADDDGDGFGDPARTHLACTQPTGWLADASDCDDADATSYPRAPEADCDDPVDHNCDGSVGATDADTDGAVACDDCDDTRADIGPDADETCDGEDDDCDGETDEADAVDATTWYTDADGDGYGDADTPVLDCYGGTGLVTDATDCDDGDDAVHPGVAGEDCATAADDDCDGVTDVENATNCLDWSTDADGDGWGDGALGCWCEPPSAESASADGDCDDTDDTISPGATEVCGDGIDQDCGESTCGLGGPATAADARALIQGEAAGDQVGSGLGAVDDLDGDGDDELLVGIPYSDRAASNAGGVLLLSGPVEGTLDASDATTLWLGESASDFAGTALDVVGDVDEDGVDDLVIGAIGYGSRAGAVFFVPLSGTGEVSLSTGLRWEGTAASDDAGTAVSAAGDTDGDGAVDVLVGAPAESTLSGVAGAAYLLTGPLSAGGALSSATAVLLGPGVDDEFGATLAGGEDLDGDGLDDVAVGAPEYDDGTPSLGAVYVYSGPVAGTLDTTMADATIAGSSRDTRAGVALAVGDLDGDGRADLAVGMSGFSAYAGLVAVYSAPTGTLGYSDAAATVLGATTREFLGQGLAVADLDGDGALDLLAGGEDVGGAARGALWWFAGPLTGGIDSSAADGGALADTAGSGGFGSSVAAAADVNGDGFGDVIAGDIGWDTPTTNAGGAWLFSGGNGE